MPKYTVRDGLPMATIPGAGAVLPGQVIEGDYERYVPGKLKRVADGAPAPKPAPKPPAPALVPAPPPAVADTEPPPPEEPEEEVEEDDEEEEERPSMDWRKDDIVAYASELQLDTSGTKREILDRIDEYLDEE
jgi:hypothetical protein